MQKTVYAIRHIEFEDLGSFYDVFVNSGYIVRYFDVGCDNLDIITQDKPNLLVVLGGPISVYDNDNYLFIDTEISILKTRIKLNLPILGICLGAQLIAKALGAKVFSGHKKEIGWSYISLTHDNITNPLNYFNNHSIKVLHWHGDTFDLPKNAVLLASSDIYKNQAFMYGQNILAMQFHIEVTNNIEKWLIGHANEISSVAEINVNKLRNDTITYAPNLINVAKQFLNNYLTSICK
jgi:GMP synthase (glutamine-hydrolysing)